jgi:hypothetical protein
MTAQTATGPAAGSGAAPTPATAPCRLTSLLPWLLFALGAAVIWTPRWPPMIDLPQHAGEVALLRDLILRQSPWNDEVWVNLFTPYLTGYALAVPLAFVMPVAMALKCVLTAAYGAFGLMGMAIRRELKASPWLDAYHYVGFFGFAYTWGFYPFLVAAPLALAFLWCAIRYARDPGPRWGAPLAVVGVILLFSHGLLLLVALPIVAWIVRERSASLAAAIPRGWPLAIPVLFALAVAVITYHREAPVSPTFGQGATMGPIEFRAMILASSGVGRPDAWWAVPCTIALAVLPFAAGLRLDTRRIESLTIAAGVFGTLLLGPSSAWSTDGLFPRFGILIPSAVAWLFSNAESDQHKVRAFVGVSLATLIVASVLAVDIAQAAAFNARTRAFAVVLARAAPGQRALSLVFDQQNGSDRSPDVLQWFPVWYQAEKQGFVDYSFAASHPEIVRFRRLPSHIYDDDMFGLEPQRFDWQRDDAGRYRYFFVRSVGPVPTELFHGAACEPRIIAASGEWHLFERCATTSRL